MNNRFLLWAVLMLVGCTSQACIVTSEDFSAEVDGRAWLMYAQGKVAGADLKRDLGYGSVSAQPEVQGSVGIWRNRLFVDYVHVDRGADGHASGSFDFGGQAIQTDSTFVSHVKSDVVQATYGFRLGPDLLSVTPMLGGAYARQQTDISGRTAPSGVNAVGLPFSAHNKDQSPLPIGGLQIESLLLDWLDLRVNASGFGIPQGYIANVETTAGIRFFHARADAGFRYVRFEFGDTRVQLLGAVLGGGVYF